MKQLMQGNEAVARGAWEAGCTVATAYPGTPSTEITEAVAKQYQGDIDAEWSPNEKVAMEVAAGAAIVGGRALVAMKHVGVNVAADPLFTAAYTGVTGALVVAVADDPGMHSSQNEQDSRFYARSAHVPMLEPADSEECRAFTKLAFELSHQYDTPVFLRLTMRIAHSRSLVEPGERRNLPPEPYEKNIQKYVMMPAMAKGRHLAVEARMNRLAEDCNELAVNRVEMRDTKLGVVTSGAAYQYVRQALPEASVFKLGMVYPLPRRQIEAFAAKVERLVVVEELEPFLEDAIKAWGIPVSGKEQLGRQGELSAAAIRQRLLGEQAEENAFADLPVRPPVLCPGCPHRSVYYTLKKLKLHVMGDIGCYTLGATAPYQSIDACVCMGASIPMALGAEKARGRDFARHTVAVIGDSTFIHSGITGLIDVVYNGGTTTVMILDNSTTGMTGHQQNPTTGRSIYNEEAPTVDLETLCHAVGVRRVVTVDPYDLEALEQAVTTEVAADEPSVIIVRRPCALIKKGPGILFKTTDRCRNCKRCLQIGCIALESGEKGVTVNPTLCYGCGMCAKICPFGAFEKEERS